MLRGSLTERGRTWAEATSDVRHGLRGELIFWSPDGVCVLREVLTPGKHDRRWGCTQGRGPLQWRLENAEATIRGWSRGHLQH